MKKFIFITGGVCSSLGKGIVAASVGRLLKSAGQKITILKLDPYLNVDPGTMSPFQHGEVFVLNDGAETDLDLGHYERFCDENLTKFSSITTGKIYTEVLEKERRGDFLGKKIQVVPHITNAICDKILAAQKATKCEILIGEIGGTVGDIEGEPFLEALRQMRAKFGAENVIFIHLTLLPFLAASKEIKTKPTQLSVRELRRAGISPDLIVCRADCKIPKKILQKVANFCGVENDAVVGAETCKSIFEVPLNFAKTKMVEVLAAKMNLENLNPDLTEWEKMVEKIRRAKKILKIALAGKYNELDDAYISVIEALRAAGFAHDLKIEIEWIDTEKIENPETAAAEFEKLKNCAGAVVPGGFGGRGIEGKILVAKFCREKNVPYLGICLGGQILAIEFARNVCGISNANSEEFNENCENKIVHFLPDQCATRAKGGTLRLGEYPCKIAPKTLAAKIYGENLISERHRHRFEFNNDFREILEKNGFVFSGLSPDGNLVEIVENPKCDFCVGVQFHPELLSRPNRPHPLFLEFVKKCGGN